MKKILLVACVCITALVTNAQTVEFIEPRNVQGVPEADFSTYKVGDNFYVLQKKYRMMAPVMYDLQLDAYDANRKPIGSNMIDKVLEMGDANLLQGFYAMKDKLVQFKSEYSKASGAKMSYLYYYPFDVTGKRQQKKLLASFPVDGAGNSGNFNVNVSPDGTRVAVISELPFEKEGMEKCIVSLYDDQFKQLWKKEYTFAYESTRGPKNNILVNNNGTVFILKQINLKKAFDQFSVFTFTENGQQVTEKKIELGNGFTIATWQHLFTAGGDLQVAGFYYMNKKVGVNVETPDGNFYLRVNGTTGELSAAKINPDERGTIIATQLLALPDNSVCLVGEHQFIGSTPIAGKPLEYSYNYTFGNTALIRLGTDGAVSWSYRIEKNMKSFSDGGRGIHSYAWVNGADINVLFADALTNHDDKAQIVTFGDKRIDLFLRFGADGKLKNKTLITDPRIGGKKGEYLFIPSTGSVYKDNKLFMLASRGLELVGATISY